MKAIAISLVLLAGAANSYGETPDETFVGGSVQDRVDQIIAEHRRAAASGGSQQFDVVSGLFFKKYFDYNYLEGLVSAKKIATDPDSCDLNYAALMGSRGEKSQKAAFRGLFYGHKPAFSFKDVLDRLADIQRTADADLDNVAKESGHREGTMSILLMDMDLDNGPEINAHLQTLDKLGIRVIFVVCTPPSS